MNAEKEKLAPIIETNRVVFIKTKTTTNGSALTCATEGDQRKVNIFSKEWNQI